jgi:hypothetical protein
LDNISLLQKLFYNNKILINSRCKELIKSLQSYSWLDEEPIDNRSGNHGSDSLRGPIVYLNKLLGSIPKYAPIGGADTVEFERPLINSNSGSLSYYYPQYQ